MTGSCVVIKGDGSKCGSKYQLNPTYLRDANGMLNKEITICQNCKQEIFGEIKQWDEKKRMEVKKLESKRNTIQKYLVGDKNTTYADIQKIGIVVTRREDLKQEFFKIINKIKLAYQERNNRRDKTCRLCKHLITCTCYQCVDRQKGCEKYSSIMTFGQKGLRGEFYPLHLICGRILFQRFGFSLLSTSKGQYELTDYIPKDK